MTTACRTLLESVDSFDGLRAALKGRCGRLDTNCKMGGSALADAISRREARYTEHDRGLLVYIDEGRYERVYYFVACGADFPEAASDKLLVIEELDVNGRRADYLQALGDKLAARGWRRQACNLQVERRLGEGDAPEIEQALARAEERLAAGGLELAMCDESMVAQVHGLWHAHLKPTDVPRAHFGFMEDPGQRVICAVDGAGRVCGVNWWEFGNGACEIRHTVTAPDCYRRGIGYAVLMAAMHDAVAHGARKAMTYIDEDNCRSIALYGKSGIVANGRTSTQFVYGEEQLNG